MLPLLVAACGFRVSKYQPVPTGRCFVNREPNCDHVENRTSGFVDSGTWMRATRPSAMPDSRSVVSAWSAGEEAGTGCAPHLSGLKPDRQRRIRGVVEELGQIEAERQEPGAGLRAVVAGSALHHVQPAVGHLHDVGTDALRLRRERVQPVPLRHEVRRRLPGVDG